MPSIKHYSRKGGIRLRRRRDGSLTREEDWHFRIQADSTLQDRVVILTTTPGLPLFGVTYAPYGMQVSAASANLLEVDTLLWDAVFTLSNQIQEGEDHDPNGNPQTGDPTTWTPVFDVDLEDYEEVFRESLAFDETETLTGFNNYSNDLAGTDTAGYNAFKWQNSAHTPYESGFVRQRRLPVRRFVQFEPITGPNAVTLEEVEDRNDTLNETTFLGKPPKTLRLMVEGISVGFYYSLRCIRADYALAFDRRDWRLKQHDVGYHHFKTSNDASSGLEPFTDESGSNVLGSLDGKGGKAADQSDPAVRYHKEYEALRFQDFLRVIYY